MATIIAGAFTGLKTSFEEMTCRARRRFETRDWRGMQADAVARLDLHPRAVRQALAAIEPVLGRARSSLRVWTAIRTEYASRIAGRRNEELARTFFNSVTRKIFSTVGVNPEIEFFELAAPRLGEPDPSIIRTLDDVADLTACITEVLDGIGLAADWRDKRGDAAAAARRIRERVLRIPGETVEAVEFIRPVFFRNKGAYVVGRLRAGGRLVPLVLALAHPDAGIVVDAVLTEEAPVSILFSFTRSYFHVKTRCPGDLVAFIRTILPRKPVAELYVSLGFNKHGKTELYRSLQSHLQSSDDHFQVAPGTRGLVMIAFTLRDHDVVFKVIRDRFPRPKHTSRREVRAQYELVFKRDRVGRLVDAQEFEHVQFHRDLFEDELLAELLTDAARTVHVDGENVIIGHLYTERRVTPLNLYLRQADPADVARAIDDYGNAIKELAKANIFPGDFVMKNFGVTRHGRVVFYDYDELTLLTDCRFRHLPAPRTPEEELEPEPWFRVGESDIFPQEFAAFIELGGEQRRAFEKRHADLYTVEFWRDLQERNRRGEVMEFFPYPSGMRLQSG